MPRRGLYQADWLMRFYGFGLDDIFARAPQGNLDLDVDPKLAWALRHPEFFPVDLNTGSKEQLLRIPGLGVRNVKRLLATRRHASIRLADLATLKVPLRKVMPFVSTLDHHPGQRLDDPATLRAQLAPPTRQMELFG